MTHYSKHGSVNSLTALLVAHGVGHAVVCPGSRNAAIVHNLEVCPDIGCVAVTDERSAAFYALGWALATGEPVAVCVTSGTALLNVVPAVAEAAFQQVPVVVISADRPAAWIGQQDGQTLPQPDALRPWVRCAVTLPERDDEEGRWHTNRLLNEALTAARSGGGGPVHINVPLNEPLFGFDVTQLPHERVIRRVGWESGRPDMEPLTASLRKARRPMVVMGQMRPGTVSQKAMARIAEWAVVVHEALCPFVGGVAHADLIVEGLADCAEARPDWLLYMGGSVVSKRLKQFLRGVEPLAEWRVETDGGMADTFCRLTGVMEAAPGAVAEALAEIVPKEDAMRDAYLLRWRQAEEQVVGELAQRPIEFSADGVVRLLEERLTGQPVAIHYANSTAVRLANLYARHQVWCNRGVNGIEGSLSTAAGFSLGFPGKVVCVTGDLSFFYDQNALWPQAVDGRLRIVLLNDGGGSIFGQLPGITESPVWGTSISGAHQTEASGICRQFGIGYIAAHTLEEVQLGLEQLLNEESQRPIVLEVRLQIP